MKTNSSKGNKSHNKESIFFGLWDKRKINSLAKFSGFLTRKTKKITPVYFIIGFLRMSAKNLKTYEDWACEIALLCGKTVSRQAVEERVTIEASNMIRLFFDEKLKSLLFDKRYPGEKYKEKFSAIRVEDSTLINLPEELHEVFPGNTSRGKRKSQLKVHALYNFTDNSFSFLDVHSFAENDQSLSANVLSYLEKGDLILRDLGFQTLTVQKRLIKEGVYFISKKKSSIKVYDVETEREINLLKKLRKKGQFDGEVLVGQSDKVKMRIVILPLPADVAEKRRRDARKNRDRRLNHSLEYYELLGYSILITNIPQDKCSSKEISELYGLRWRIETIFKSWKSYLSIDKLMPEKTNKPERIECIIYLLLLYIVMFQTSFLRKIIVDDPDKLEYSILKLTKVFKQHFIRLLENNLNNKTLKCISKNAKYDKRKDRNNTMEKFVKLAA